MISQHANKKFFNAETDALRIAVNKVRLTRNRAGGGLVSRAVLSGCRPWYRSRAPLARCLPGVAGCLRS